MPEFEAVEERSNGEDLWDVDGVSLLPTRAVDDDGGGAGKQGPR